MEKKTMGTFIAALRKANGLTQRELAERLNVSDKAVSRWERDENSPDLSLIPVIAELFGVTADELLCGERLYDSDDPRRCRAAEKSEKEINNLLERTCVSFKVKSVISCGVAIAGLIAAMIANLGFNRGYVGFFAACVFYLAAAVCEAAFLIPALSAFGHDYAGETVSRGKRTIVRSALWVFSLIIVLFAATLPIISLLPDPYMGISGKSWFNYGGLFALAGLLLCLFAAWVVDGVLVRRGVYSLSEKQAKLRRLKIKCTLVTLAVMVCTLVLHMQLISDTSAYADKIVFDNYEDFIALMAEKREAEYYGPAAPAPDSPVQYYDEDGNPISEWRSRMREIKNSDGELILRYYQYNEQIVSVSYPLTDTCLPITVITQDAMRAAAQTMRMVSSIFIAVYVFEALAGLAVYGIRRKKV